MSEARFDDQSLRTPGVRHEVKDVSLRGLLVFLAVLAVVGVLVHYSVALLFRELTGGRVAGRRGPALSSVELQSLPAGPVIEGLAPQSRPAAEQPPASYGWVDRDRGIVRIPVELAIQLVSKTTAARSEQPEGVTPTDANGGQTQRGAR